MTSPLHTACFVAPDILVRGVAVGRAVRVVMQRSGFAAVGGGCTTT